jgi:hypothetical protein
MSAYRQGVVWLKGIVAILLLTSSSLCLGANQPLDIKSCWKINAKKGVEIHFEISNRSDRDVRIDTMELPWNIFASGYYLYYWADGFVVPVERVNRIEDVVEITFAQIRPHETISGLVDLSYYFLTRRKPANTLVVLWSYSLQLEGFDRLDASKAFFLHTNDDRCKQTKGVD